MIAERDGEVAPGLAAATADLENAQRQGLPTALLLPEEFRYGFAVRNFPTRIAVIEKAGVDGERESPHLSGVSQNEMGEGSSHKLSRLHLSSLARDMSLGHLFIADRGRIRIIGTATTPIYPVRWR
jgi:hypothetical protein